MGIVGPLWKNVTSFVSLGIDEISEIFSFVSIFRLPFSKPFSISLNYAPTSNAQEVTKVYNLGD